MAGPASNIHQLKATLRDSRPAIWRRVEVPAGMTLGDLHEVLQTLFGWQDSHMHQFVVEGEKRGAPTSAEVEALMTSDTSLHALRGERLFSDRRFAIEGTEDEHGVTVADIAPREKMKFHYEYDFGDSWEVELLVEKIVPAGAGVIYPRCTAGRRASPMDDAGGVWGWEEMMEAVNDRKHERHQEVREWMGLKKGQTFDPEKFDPAEVNEQINPGQKGWAAAPEGEGAGKVRRGVREQNATEGGEGLREFQYEITTEPLQEMIGEWPSELSGRQEELLERVRERPSEVIGELERLAVQYPNAPRLGNFLTAAYSAAGRDEAADRQIEAGYRKHPDYLFARVNYANLLMERGLHEQVPAVFGGQWDVGAMYPARKIFHITEAVAFLFAAGRYWAETGDLYQAEMAFEMLADLDPDGPFTQRLERILFKEAMTGAMEQLMTNAVRRATRKKKTGKGKRKKK